MNGATWEIRTGDCRDRLRELEAGSVHTVVTSPPYFALRDYDIEGQIGLEPTPDEFVDAIVTVFREVWRVLRDDGTVWLNLGDTYNAYNGNRGGGPQLNGVADAQRNRPAPGSGLTVPTMKAKDLIGVPWMVAFALRADGWYLRSEVIWNKPNPMPESVVDRPTRSHEQVFLLTKSGRTLLWTHRDGRAANELPPPDHRWLHPETGQESVEPKPAPWRRVNLWRGHDYYYDAVAIRETAVAPFDDPVSWEERKAAGATWGNVANELAGGGTQRVVHGEGVSHALGDGKGRNKRSVWTVSTVGFKSPAGFEDVEHFATFPPKLIVPCVLAGAPERACATCGAPWMRATEVERPPPAPTRPKDLRGTIQHGGVESSGLHRSNSHDGANVNVTRTVGFAASCAHGAPAVPGVVLDPFAGAATTGVVSMRLGRSFVGVELNERYAEMARARVRDDAPLFNVGAELASA